MDADPAQPNVLQFGRDILHDEARALDAHAESLSEPFERAVAMILEMQCGAGRGERRGDASFLHLAEAIHGDMGIAAKGDVALLISQSGSTSELEAAIEHFAAVGILIVAMTGDPLSMLAEASAARSACA